MGRSISACTIINNICKRKVLTPYLTTIGNFGRTTFSTTCRRVIIILEIGSSSLAIASTRTITIRFRGIKCVYGLGYFTMITKCRGGEPTIVRVIGDTNGVSGSHVIKICYRTIGTYRTLFILNGPVIREIPLSIFDLVSRNTTGINANVMSTLLTNNGRSYCRSTTTGKGLSMNPLN